VNSLPHDDENNNHTPNANNADAHSGASSSAHDQQLNANVLRLLRRLGLALSSDDTSLCLTAYARRVSGEEFEAMLSELDQVRQLWEELVTTRPARRITSNYLDEVIWITRNLRCQHAPPHVVARYLGVGAAIDVGVTLAKRLRC
jgi:hypothetical protein